MSACVPPSSYSGADRFLLVQPILIPAGFAIAALGAHLSGLDERVSAMFFDATANTFPAHAWPLLETIGHRIAKSAAIGVWLALLTFALAASLMPRLSAYARLAWTTALAMALGPTIVVMMKDLNAYRCPWDLKQFGGIAEYTSGWFVSTIKAGHCFPSGHAAGGFSFVALYFAGWALGNRKLRLAGLITTLIAGTAFSLVRIAQGAHFLSHNLWSAAIDWCAAALVFAPIMLSAPIRDSSACAGFGPDAPTPVAPTQSARGWRRVYLAAGYSLTGLAATWRREAAFRQEVVVSALLAPVALLAPLTRYERCALLASLVLVLIVELLNTALEAVVDLVSPDPHPLAGFAKDAGSAAVLLSIVIAVGMWISVLFAER